jgi:hypothetical protein
MDHNTLQELQGHLCKVDLGSNGARAAQHMGRPLHLWGSLGWSSCSMGHAIENPRSQCRSLTGRCC